MSVLSEKLRRRKIDDQSSRFHQRNSVSQQQSLAQIVCHKDHGFLHTLLQSAKLLLHLRSRDGIERAERFVENQNSRIGRKRACNTDALSLSSRKLAGITRRKFRAQSYESQQLSHARGDPLPRPVLNPRHERDVAFHGEMRKQTAILNDIADAAPKLNRIPVRSAGSVDTYFARSWQQQTINQLQSGRLSRATAAEQNQSLARFHGEHQILKQRSPVQTERDMIEFDGRRVRERSSHAVVLKAMPRKLMP
jgi:hypothetical protein